MVIMKLSDYGPISINKKKHIWKVPVKIILIYKGVLIYLISKIYSYLVQTRIVIPLC